MALTAWWNSPEAAGVVANWGQGFGVLFALLAAIAGGIGLTARMRQGTLLALAPRVAATEAAVRPRGFSPEQRAALVEHLRPVAKAPIEFSITHGDAEAFGFAQQLKGVLEAAGFEVGAMNATISTSRLPPLLLLVHDAQTAPPCAGTLQKGLVAVGFEAHAEVQSGVPAGALHIQVGPKPLPSG